MRRSLGTAAAGILLFSGSVMFVPSFAVYAKQIPGMEAAIKWLESAGEYIGIRNAKEHGYISTPSYKTKWGNREVSVDNLFLEDDRLHVDITIKGEDIAEAQRNGRMTKDVGGLTWSPEFGMIVDNYARWNANDKKPVYDIAIIAPKLEEYEISIRRFMEPVTINQKIEFTIPPTGAGDGQEGTLLEPKYAKTVAELDVSVVEQARREMREAAGHDIELYGVEEYKGAAYYNVTVYSKDHKSRIALDLNKGTANVHVSMSYSELPSDLEHIIETATRMNGSQLAAEVKKLTRTKSANERIIHTSLEGDMTMTLEDNRIESMFVTVPMDQVDAQALAVAEQAVRDLKGKHVPLVKASHHLYSRYGQPINIYVFEDQKNDLRIEVGFQTERLISVYTSEDLEAGTDATEDIFRKFTDDQVLEVAAPYVQKLFDIDLNGYEVEREKGTSYYTFTVEDGPAIKASMNRHFKFYDLEILTENGAVE